MFTPELRTGDEGLFRVVPSRPEADMALTKNWAKTEVFDRIFLWCAMCDSDHESPLAAVQAIIKRG